MKLVKSEIQARIDECRKLKSIVASRYFASHHDKEYLGKILEERICLLEKEEINAEEDIFMSVIRSHKAICAVKNMDEKGAYGQNPALYYSLAICAESGEMGNKIVRALRNGENHEACLTAIVSELPDVVIYSCLLAYIFDIDLGTLVNEKVDIVIDRARNGYYGGPIQNREQ